MKKIILIYIIVLIVLISFGCQNDSINNDVYIYSNGIMLNEAEENGFQYNIVSQAYETLNQSHSEIMNIPDNKTFSFFNVDFDLRYKKSYSRQLKNEKILCFFDEKSNSEFGFFEGSEILAYAHIGDVKINVTDVLPVEENDFMDICRLLDPDICNNNEYEVTCETYSIVTNENGVRTEKTDGFIALEQLPDNSSTQYIFTYMKYIENVQTDDSVTIKLNTDGTIGSITYISNDSYNNNDVLHIDIESARERIDETISEMCNSDGFEVKSYEASEMLITTNNTISLASMISPVIEELSTGEVFSPETVTLITSAEQE